MKTAGVLLREKRLRLELGIEAVAAKLKVKPEYLLAIEESDFSSLPSGTAIKGFLRNYARLLAILPKNSVRLPRL